MLHIVRQSGHLEPCEVEYFFPFILNNSYSYIVCYLAEKLNLCYFFLHQFNASLYRTNIIWNQGYQIKWSGHFFVEKKGNYGLYSWFCGLDTVTGPVV